MQVKNLFVFLLAVALVFPLVTAYNCSSVEGEAKKICKHIEKSDWSKSEKDDAIEELIESGGSLKGDFKSIIGKSSGNKIELNKIEDIDTKLNNDDKKFIIDLSSISLIGYVVYSFIRKYYLHFKIL
jgi:hypothetical protein